MGRRKIALHVGMMLIAAASLSLSCAPYFTSIEQAINAIENELAELDTRVTAEENERPIPGAPGQDGQQGPPGPQGPAGPAGPTGNQGPTGPAGTDGAPGTNGTNGKDGTPGTNGTNGKDGVDGKDGADGKDGKDGIDGKDGANGKDGVDGKDGKDGVDGKDGKDLTGVLARAQIDASGNNLSDPNVVESRLVDPNKPGIYELVAHLPQEFDVQNRELDDFPIVVTGKEFGAINDEGEFFVASYRPIELDKNARTLKFRVYIRRWLAATSTFAYENGQFSAVIMQW